MNGETVIREGKKKTPGEARSKRPRWRIYVSKQLHHCSGYINKSRKREEKIRKNNFKVLRNWGSVSILSSQQRKVCWISLREETSQLIMFNNCIRFNIAKATTNFPLISHHGLCEGTDKAIIIHFMMCRITENCRQTDCLSARSMAERYHIALSILIFIHILGGRWRVYSVCLQYNIPIANFYKAGMNMCIHMCVCIYVDVCI